MIRMFKDERNYWGIGREKGVWNHSYLFNSGQRNVAEEIFNREIIKLRGLKKEVVLVEIHFSDVTSVALLLIEKEHLQEFEEKYLENKK